MTFDEDIFEGIIWVGEGASTLSWEVAARCTCWTLDTRMPKRNCPICGGFGIKYATPVLIPGLFRAQSRYISSKMEGEFDHGEAQLSTKPEHKPGFTDRRVRDRYTVVPATGDPRVATYGDGDYGTGDYGDPPSRGRIFYPAAPPVPFLFGDQQLAWRVTVTSMDQADRLVPQP